jgi:hypothetical protein
MEIETNKCEKCGGILAKTGIMESGNSKFIKFSCKACGHSHMKCEGVMKQS